MGPEWVILASGSCSGRKSQAVVLVMHAGAGHSKCGPMLDDRKRAALVLEEEPVGKVWGCSGCSEDKVQKLESLEYEGVEGKRVTDFRRQP